MARPCKPVSTRNGHIVKTDYDKRSEAEAKLKGASDHIKENTMPLTIRQQEIRNILVAELEPVLANVDRFLLDHCAIVLERLQDIEMKINTYPDLLYDRQTLSAKRCYFEQYTKLCNELSLSPQARAKLANAQPKAKEEEKSDPLMELLMDEED